MGELDSTVKSSAEVYFDETQVVVVTLKSWARRPGVRNVESISMISSNEALGCAARHAWDSREWFPERDDEAVAESWERLARLFEEADRSKIRRVVLTRSDQLYVVPSEWKGDTRAYIQSAVLALSHDASDEELGAAIRRAMELTVS